MYSPKIQEDIIPDLYRIAKARHIPMTKLVNDIVWDAIKNIKIKVVDKGEVGVVKTKEYVEEVR